MVKSSVQIEITLLTAIMSSVIALACFAAGRLVTAKKAGEQDGEIKADIRYIKKLAEDSLLEQRRISETVSCLGERVTRLEENICTNKCPYKKG
jgi:hypothetical protein